jgi:hypothetical protein
MGMKVQNLGIKEKIMDLYFWGCKSITMGSVCRFLEIAVI